MHNYTKPFTFVNFLLLFCILLCACQPVDLNPPPNRKTPLFEYYTNYQERQQAISTARQLIAKRTQQSISDVKTISVETSQWNNNCLGMPAPDEICSDDHVDGYLITFLTKDLLYEVHMDGSGQNIRISSPTNSASAPQEKTIRLLATQLNIAIDEISMVSIQPVQWKDSCLEISGSGNCEPVITPGFRIILEARTQQFEYHTNQDASLIYGGMTPKKTTQSENVDPLSEYLTLSMERSYFTSTMIEQLVISKDYSFVISNNEGMEKRGLQLSENEREQLNNFKISFADTTFTIREDNAQWEATVHLYGQGFEPLPDYGQEILLNFVLELYAREASVDTK